MCIEIGLGRGYAFPAPGISSPVRFSGICSVSYASSRTDAGLRGRSESWGKETACAPTRCSLRANYFVSRTCRNQQVSLNGRSGWPCPPPLLQRHVHGTRTHGTHIQGADVQTRVLSATHKRCVSYRVKQGGTMALGLGRRGERIKRAKPLSRMAFPKLQLKRHPHGSPKKRVVCIIDSCEWRLGACRRGSLGAGLGFAYFRCSSSCSW